MTNTDSQRYNKTYYLKHAEKIKARSERYYLVHSKKYLLTHPEQEEINKIKKEKRVKGGLEFLEAGRIATKRYQQTTKGKKTIWRRNAKRRDFGFNFLNKIFPGSAGHHIDRERVIFVPSEMHITNRHSVTKDRGMERMNTLAFNWLEAEELYATI